MTSTKSEAYVVNKSLNVYSVLNKGLKSMHWFHKKLTKAYDMNMNSE